MPRYEGLDPALRAEVLDRDRHRCRWCGATNRPLDLHHVRYRRGFADDVASNLISLCRAHHSFVHGIKNGAGMTITKNVAQLVLFELVEKPGVTGSSLWRRLKRQWVMQGRCEKHGEEKDICQDCRWEGRMLVPACVECGNDDPAQGYDLCSDCLEATS